MVCVTAQTTTDTKIELLSTSRTREELSHEKTSNIKPKEGRGHTATTTTHNDAKSVERGTGMGDYADRVRCIRKNTVINIIVYAYPLAGMRRLTAGGCTI